MVKQTKKGSIGKKALSAILAASMIMTSSSFVMAGPVVEEVEAVAVEEAAVVDAVEEVDVAEDNARALLTSITVEDDNKATGYEYNGKAQLPELTVEAKVDNVDTSLKLDEDYTVTAANNTDVGTATYTVKFDQTKYPGVPDKTGTFEIKKATLANTDNVTVKMDMPEGLAYNGKEQYPTVKEAYVTFGTGSDAVKVPLTAEDYTIDVTGKDHSGKKPVDADTYTVKLTDIGNDNFDVTGEVTDLGEYTIGQVDFTDSLLEVVSKPVTATGSPVRADITLKLGDAEIKVASDTFEIKYYDPYDADKEPQTTAIAKVPGTYKVQLTPTATSKNFVQGGKIETTYVIEGNSFQKMIEDADVIATGGNVTENDGKWEASFTGSEMQFTLDSIAELTGQYKVEAVKGTDLGTYQIVVTGLREYAGQTATVDVAIVPKKLTDTSDYTITATKGLLNGGKPSDKVFVKIIDTKRDKDGNAVLNSGAYVLVEGKDYTYTVDAKNNVVITGIGNYTTVLNKTTSTIKKAITPSTTINLNEEKISASISGTYAYTGSKITPQGEAIKVIDNTGATTYTLVQDTDYTLSYGDNINAGEGTVTINGKGKYAGSIELKFNIEGTAFDSVFEVKPMKDQKLADAKQGAQSVYVVYKETGAYAGTGVRKVKYYQNGKDITDSYATDVKAGTVDVEVSGKGKYVGTIKTSYEVIGTDIATVITKIDDIAPQNYTGSEITPSVKITASETLEKDKDYTVTYENNVKVGEGRVIITGIGQYSGKVIVPFSIVGEMTQEIVVLPAQEKALKSRTLNDKATKVKFEVEPETTKTFTSSDEDVVTVDAEGNIKYTGLGEATITIKAAAENGYKEAVKELKVVVGLKQPTFSPSSKNNAFTVTTSTVKGAEKFQVQYVPTGKSFTSKAAKSKTFTVDNKLKKGKISAANKETYRIRVRAINGDTKSKWSPVKTIATK